MTTTTSEPTTTTVTTGWGVAVTTPNGRTEIQEIKHLVDAISNVERINGAAPGAAAIVYRDEEYGPWSLGLDGNAFGTRYIWGDGHTEYEPADTRAEADRHTRLRNNGNPGASARTVSRQVTYGEWQPFTGAQPSPRPAPDTSWVQTTGH